MKLNKLKRFGTVMVIFLIGHMCGAFDALKKVVNSDNVTSEELSINVGKNATLTVRKNTKDEEEA